MKPRVHEKAKILDNQLKICQRHMDTKKVWRGDGSPQCIRIMSFIKRSKKQALEAAARRQRQRQRSSVAKTQKAGQSQFQ